MLEIGYRRVRFTCGFVRPCLLNVTPLVMRRLLCEVCGPDLDPADARWQANLQRNLKQAQTNFLARIEVWVRSFSRGASMKRRITPWLLPLATGPFVYIHLYSRLALSTHHRDCICAFGAFCLKFERQVWPHFGVGDPDRRMCAAAPA